MSAVFEKNTAELQCFLDQWKENETKFILPDIALVRHSFEELVELSDKFHPKEGYYHKSHGVMQRDEENGDWIDTTKNQAQANLDAAHKFWCSACSKLFISRDVYEMHRTFDPAKFNAKICSLNKCDVFFDGKYTHSYGEGMLGKRTRKITNEELLRIDVELKKYKEAVKKRDTKVDEKKSKKNPVLVAQRKMSLQEMVEWLKQR